MHTGQTDSLLETLGPTLKYCRESVGMSIEEFAATIDESPISLLDIESGRTKPSVLLIMNCARALDLTIIELLELAINNQSLIILEEDVNVLFDDVATASYSSS